MTHAEFEQIVRQAVRSIPNPLRDRLENVDLVISEWPTQDDLHLADVPPGRTLFGLYSGVPITERTGDYTMVLPDRITIYRGPLLETHSDVDTLHNEIRATVIHEFAHFFGLTDENLESMGVF